MGSRPTAGAFMKRLIRNSAITSTRPAATTDACLAACRSLRSEIVRIVLPKREGSIRGLATQATDVASAEAGPSTIPDISLDDTYDIVIIGGANAGLALACALLDKPSLKKTARILLLEGGSLERTRSWTGEGPWENRVSSLTAENVAWLGSIGVWQHIKRHRTCPVEEMIVWANPSTSATPTLHFPPLGHPMAHMTENTNLQQALLRRIESIGTTSGYGSFAIRETSRVAEMRLGPGGRWVGLRIGDHKWVRGSVVVGADGPNSPVRKFSGIESYGHAYDTHAVVATLEHEASAVYPNNTAFQRFLPTGPLAFLPLSPTASTLVWSTRPAHAAAYKRLPIEALVMMVNAGYTLQEAPLAVLNSQVLAADAAGSPTSAERLVDILRGMPMPDTPAEQIIPQTIRSIPPTSVASFPLRLTHADAYLGDRTVLVGDAAHTIHPLAGQGLNMGLADVRVLADVWEKARRTGGDLGSHTSMADYPRIRYPANHLMLSTTDHLNFIFGNRSAPLNWARGVGLDVLNELGPIKKALMGGAGAGMGAKAMSEMDRRFGRAEAGDERNEKAAGWPSLAADGLEGWLGFKRAAGMVGGMAGEIASNGLRRAGKLLQRR